MSEGQATAQKSGAPDPLIGRVIADRFRITSLIARGGMGKVYRAEQAALGRSCAIKVLNPNYNGDADPEFHRRFFREASITAKITHPNCVTIFDYGKTDDDIYFMAMEYLEGQTLHHALRDHGVMHEVRAGRIASQVCRALREAHKLGVIHRDLKPANIFLTRPNSRPRDANGTIPPASEEDEDFVKVLDFGLVKHLAERPEEQLTQTGLFMGSPKYMAPEQIQGGHVDERTDIYSLGIIMYEMLAGKVPFERATSVNILMAHVGEPPPPMREVNPNLVCSTAFEEIVMCCIAKDPNQRLASMDHVLHAIRRVHGGSMTGPIAAINMTGPHFVSGGIPPPPVYTPTPYGTPLHGSVPAMQVTPQSTHASVPSMRAVPAFVPLPVGPPPPLPTATGTLRTETSIDFGSAFMEGGAPRSKIWIALGVLAAAGIGGGLGMLAFQVTAPAPPIAQPTPTLSAPATASPSPTTKPAEAGSSSAAPPSSSATVKLTSDPSGASVREDGKELCAATPCDVSFKGDDGKVHKVVLSHAGFRPETRTVKASDGTLHVKLAHAAAPKPAPKPESSATSGFKDAYEVRTP